MVSRPREVAGGNLTTAGALAGLVVITALCLVPFAGKAFHIDDPLYIWAAKQIQENPFNFYGFMVNWSGVGMPMPDIMKNPPLVSYYIALVTYLVGWNEVGLHFAFLIPAIAVVLGTYVLARRFCSQPLLATLMGILTPAFLLSATTIMSDIPMLAFWVWSVVFWIRGLEKDELLAFLVAGVFIACSALAKYYGISLIPLLLAYSLMKKRNIGLWMVGLLVPIVILYGYHTWTEILYGRSLLFDGASYAVNVRANEGLRLFEKGLVGVTFIGGCFLTLLFYAPFLWAKRALMAGGVLTVIIAITLVSIGRVGAFSLVSHDSILWLPIVEFSLLATCGVSLLVLAIADVWKERDAPSMFLFLWVIGTFVFASFVNWTTNGRSILPMMPAVGILLVRRMDLGGWPEHLRTGLKAMWPLVPGLVMGLLVTLSDYQLAASAREAAGEIRNEYHMDSHDLWFVGHWGFQYYLELSGGKAIDVWRSRFREGDIVVIPENNDRSRFRMDGLQLVRELRFTASNWLGIMSRPLGAGFYSSGYGPLPFTVGAVPPERYYILSVQN